MSAMLETSRLVLREPVMADAEAIAAYLDDFGVAGNLARVPHPYRLGDARAWLRTRRPGMPPGETNFSIDLAGEGCIGAVGFHQGAYGTIIGYWLGRPYWGQGIMTQAAGQALDWFFARSEAQKVLSGVFAFNAASLAVQNKLGFVETGRSTLHCLARGADLEHIDTELTRSAWTARER
jgi:RimJ/RimL family protein N-acetyltransferase